MLKYAVFDIKLRYNHYIFVSSVPLHSPKISFGGQWRHTSDWEGALPPSAPLPLKPLVKKLEDQRSDTLKALATKKCPSPKLILDLGVS